MSTLNVDIVNATAGFVPASYTTANLPTGQAVGSIVYDSTEQSIKVFDGSSWRGAASSAVTASGGNNIFTEDGHTVHIFTGTGTFSVTNPGMVEYLVVAGGGAGGGGDVGGGGGAGGLLYGRALFSAGSYAVSVGAGGTGIQSSGSYGGKGIDSQLGPYIAKGGGGGGGWGAGQQTQGSGGSGGAATSTNRTGYGIKGQGNDGGYPGRGSPNYPQPGGGGAGEPGQPSYSHFITGRGGDGRAVPIISTTNALNYNVGQVYDDQVWFAGGGAGGAESNQNPDIPTERGGLGGGGKGGRQTNNLNAVAGTARTGGGGGGEDPQAGANGGSGVVIVRYKN